MPFEHPPRMEREPTPITRGNVREFLTAAYAGNAEAYAVAPERLSAIANAHVITRPMSRVDAGDLARRQRTILSTGSGQPTAWGSADQRRHADEQDEDAQANALFAEQALLPLVDANEWFGDDVRLSRTNEWDDWVNGADLVMTVETDDEPLYLSIDVTTSVNPAVFKEKRDAVLRKNALTDIKYFEDPETHDWFSLTTIPHVILPLSPEGTLKDLQKEVALFFSDQSNKQERDGVEESTIPCVLLEIIIKQLRAWMQRIDTPAQRRKKIPNEQTIRAEVAKLTNALQERLEQRVGLYGTRAPDRAQRMLLALLKTNE